MLRPPPPPSTLPPSPSADDVVQSMRELVLIHCLSRRMQHLDDERQLVVCMACDKAHHTHCLPPSHPPPYDGTVSMAAPPLVLK
jgi:hypothetical protein